VISIQYSVSLSGRNLCRILRRVEEQLNHKVQALDLFRLQVLRALAKIGDGEIFQDFRDGIADFFHDAADPAFGLVGARALFVESFAHTSHRGERSFHVPDDMSQRDSFRGFGQTVTA